MSDFRSELCKKCIHTKVCMKDKNVVGDVFVAGNPMIFDNEKLWKEYKEREAQGFPCKDFMDVSNVQPVRHGRWKPYDLTYGRSIYYCTACDHSAVVPTALDKPLFNYCPNCGAKMDGDSE